MLEGDASYRNNKNVKHSKTPIFFGKAIRHKYEENGSDVWYKGVVVSCLDEDEYDNNCEFEVVYEGSDEKFCCKVGG